MARVSHRCLFLAALAACGDDSHGRTPDGGVPDAGGPVTLSGVAQKGPFITGTGLIIQELDDGLLPTGRTTLSQTTDDLGRFAVTVTPATNLLEVVGTGYYFDEIGDRLSTSTLSLRGITRPGDDIINLNVLTTIEKKRLISLVGQGAMFDDAKAEAQADVLSVFGITASDIPPSQQLDITSLGDGGAILLAVSAILQQMAWYVADDDTDVTSELSVLLAQLEADVEDGELDDPDLRMLIARSSVALDLPRVRAALEERYDDLGEAVTIPPFEDFVDSDGDGMLNGDDPVSVGSDELHSLPAPRCTYHSTTALDDGSLLVVGGNSASSLLIDPETLGVTTTGSLSAQRWGHSAVKLADGRILIAGGVRQSITETAEVFDPGEGSFSTVQSMELPRYEHTATLLDDGRVLVVGGLDASFTSSAQAEIFDPSGPAFTLVGSLVSGRAGHTATLLDDGRVLVAGGYTRAGEAFDNQPIASAELFDPVAGSFSPAGSLQVARQYHSAVALSNGGVLVAGGDALGDTVVPVSELELFDPSTESFEVVDFMFEPRTNMGAIRLGGEVLLMGGVNVAAYSAAVEIVGEQSGTVRRGGSLMAPRAYAEAVALPGGRIALVGGYGGGCLDTMSIWTQ